MAGKMFRRWIPLLLVLAVAAILWWVQVRRRPPTEYAVAYVSDPSAIVWNANAQVRQPVTTLHYGDRVTILQRSGDRAEVRGDSGIHGWIEVSTLMPADLWKQGAELLTRARSMPVQARGHTRTISNIRLTAGRDGPRIFQFGRNEPVVVLERATSPVPQEDAGETPATTAAQNLPKLEDWLFVLRTQTPGSSGETLTSASSGVSATSLASPAVSSSAPNSASGATTTPSPAVPIAGWVLARFIQLDPPQPIPDYFSASGIRVVSWVVLSTVQDESGPQPQYLVAGARGGEGQSCDFTLLRVYTWGTVRHRYETAYVENDICGRMPIRVTSSPAESEFRFVDPAQGGADRVYRMRQTSVRRVTGTNPPQSKRK